MLPADLEIWRTRQDAGERNPWSETLTFLADGAPPNALDTSYLTDADRSNPDIAANVEAVLATAALVTWAAEDEDETRAFGYWRSPRDTPLAEAPVVVIDSEWQFALTYGTNLSEALCYEYGEYVDDGYDGLVGKCRALGVEITVDHPADFTEPSAAPTPDDHHRELYRRLRGPR